MAWLQRNAWWLSAAGYTFIVTDMLIAGPRGDALFIGYMGSSITYWAWQWRVRGTFAWQRFRQSPLFWFAGMLSSLALAHLFDGAPPWRVLLEGLGCAFIATLAIVSARRQEAEG